MSDDEIKGLKERLIKAEGDRDLYGEALGEIRQMLDTNDVFPTSFIDDHVGNAIWQRNVLRRALERIAKKRNVLRRATIAKHAIKEAFDPPRKNPFVEVEEATK